MVYPKAAITPQEQVVLLKSRGMVFADEAAAATLLGNIGYYHLGFYWFNSRQEVNPQDKKDNSRRDQFYRNTYFEKIIAFYEFDRQLKQYIWQAIEKLEISLKTRWADEFSRRHKDSLFYTKPTYHNPGREEKTFQASIAAIRKKFNDSQEPFILNFKAKAPKTALPEAWIITEILSFGDFFYCLRFLKKNHQQFFAHLYAADKSRDFLKAGDFIKILSQLRIVRNICAHHGRLWNNSFPHKALPTPDTSPLLKGAWNSEKGSKKIYNLLCSIVYLLRSIDSRQAWRQDFIEFIKQHENYTYAMGFPTYWRVTPLWR